MKYLSRSLFSLGAVGISAGITVVNSAPLFAAPLDDLVSAYERRYQAMTEQDDSGYGYWMSDELLIFPGPNVRPITKAQSVSSIANNPTHKVIRVEQPETPRFRVYGDMGTVTGKTQYTVQSDNKLIVTKERFLDVWRKINGRWQLVIRRSIAVE